MTSSQEAKATETGNLHAGPMQDHSEEWTEADGWPVLDAELGEFGKESEHGPLAALEGLFSSAITKARERVIAERAWDFYNQLDERSKNDSSILQNMLRLLSSQKVISAQEQVKELAERIVRSGEPDSYRTAISTCLKMGLFQTAARIHRDAATTLTKEASFGSNRLFKYAISHHHWTTALHVRDLYLEYRERLGLDRGNLEYSTRLGFDEEIHELWDGVGGIQGITHHIEDLLLRHRSPLGNTKDQRERQRQRLESLIKPIFHHFLAHCVKERHIWTNYRRGMTARAAIRSLMCRLCFQPNLGVATRWIYEDCLTQLTGIPDGANKDKLFFLIGRIYSAYRRSWAFRPTEFVLHKMLQYWCSRRLVVSEDETPGSIFSLGRLVTDWKNHHNKLDDGSIIVLMSTFARIGKVRPLEHWLSEYLALFPEGLPSADALWPLIYVHAKRADLPSARKAFERISTQFKLKPTLQCYSVLIYAHEKVDDVDGALELLNTMEREGIQPNAYSYTPVFEMYARQGDVEGLNELINIAEDQGVELNTYSRAMLMLANSNSDDMSGAEELLSRTIEDIENGTIEGNLGMCFTFIMGGYTRRQDIEGTMQTYNRMRALNIKPDGQTLASIIRVLCAHNQTPAAEKILSKVMPEYGIRPTAHHYALVMLGYTNQRRLKQVRRLHQEMEDKNIPQTVSSRTIWLQARALMEDKEKPVSDDTTEEPEALEETIKELMQSLDETDIAAFGLDQPLINNKLTPADQAVAAGYFENIILIHGKRRCFQAVEYLYNQYLSVAARTEATEKPPPIRILTAMMSAYHATGDYAQIDHYWALAKSTADQLSRLHASPSEVLNFANTKPSRRPNPLLPSVKLDPQTGQPMLIRRTRRSKSTSPDVAAVAPGPHRFLLSRAFTIYIRSLFDRNRVSDITNTVATLLSQGYALDNRAWNAYIELLLRASPPRALLAFSLMERYMMSSWPGWVNIKGRSSPRVRPQARKEGMLYIKARYLRHTQLVPLYNTMVYAARALLDLRNVEAMGVAAREGKEVEKQVGTVRLLRENAPKTCFAVQSLPRVMDGIQKAVLGRGIKHG